MFAIICEKCFKKFKNDINNKPRYDCSNKNDELKTLLNGNLVQTLKVATWS